MSFLVDSDVFTNSTSVPTRGYHIDETSFVLTMGSASVGLQSPFPAGQTPYFVIRNDDPAVDGFFTATSVDFPIGVPLSQTGVFGQFINNYSVTYVGTTLSSLNILGALGTYNFTGLTVFNWTIDDGPFNAMGILFEPAHPAQLPPPASTSPPRTSRAASRACSTSAPTVARRTRGVPGPASSA